MPEHWTLDTRRFQRNGESWLAMFWTSSKTGNVYVDIVDASDEWICQFDVEGVDITDDQLNSMIDSEGGVA